MVVFGSVKKSSCGRRLYNWRTEWMKAQIGLPFSLMRYFQISTSEFLCTSLRRLFTAVVSLQQHLWLNAESPSNRRTIPQLQGWLNKHNIYVICHPATFWAQAWSNLTLIFFEMGDVKPPTSDSDVSNNSKRQLEKFTQENPTFGSILVHQTFLFFFQMMFQILYVYTPEY